MTCMSQICQSGVHCRTCRDKEGGRDWRRSLTCEIPGKPDFECPLGVQWNEKHWQPGTAFAKMLDSLGVEQCAGCSQRKKKIDELWVNFVARIKRT